MIFNFSSGVSTFPVNKILPSNTCVLTFKNNFYLTNNNLASKFLSIIPSSICVPKVLGSRATVTPVPKTPFDEAPTHPDKIKNINKKFKFFLLSFFQTQTVIIYFFF